MHLDDFFKKPYKLWTYLIFTVFQLTLWIQNIVLAVWLLRILNFFTANGSPFYVIILIYFTSGVSSIYIIYLTVYMCWFGCCRKKCYQNLDYPSKYVLQFSILLIVAAIWLVSSIMLSRYGFSHDGLCKEYVTKGICEGNDIWSLDKKIINKDSKNDDDRYTNFCPGKKYLASWQYHYIDLFYDKPSYFCSSVAVPVFLLAMIFLGALFGLGYLYYRIKKECKDNEIFSTSSTIQNGLLNQENNFA